MNPVSHAIVPVTPVSVADDGVCVADSIRVGAVNFTLEAAPVAVIPRVDVPDPVLACKVAEPTELDVNAVPAHTNPVIPSGMRRSRTWALLTRPHVKNPGLAPVPS